MADIKREQEREELHRAIWAIADELRGAVDGWDFKNYVLGTMCWRYISESLCSYINRGEAEAGNAGFDYAQMPDAEAEEARGAKFFFAVRHRPWQRGTNENTNGLLREYFPKQKPLDKVRAAEVKRVYDKLNKRPRKRLGYRTPYEAHYGKPLHLI